MIFYEDGAVVIQNMTEARRCVTLAAEYCGQTAAAYDIGTQFIPPYGDCRNDDDLVLYLSKKLR